MRFEQTQIKKKSALACNCRDAIQPIRWNNCQLQKMEKMSNEN